MIVTEIKEISKSKVKVTLDYETTFAVYKGELRTYQLREQEEVSQETYKKLMAALEKRAKLRCMNLLKSRDYTSHQLYCKLHENGYPDQIAKQAIAYVSSYGYVDDRRYVYSYIESALQNKNRRQIENDLLRKGIDKQLIESTFADLKRFQETDTEDNLIRKFLEKKHYDPSIASYEDRRKVIAFLYRKGFSLDKIYKIVGEIE